MMKGTLTHFKHHILLEQQLFVFDDGQSTFY
jgi:hypothetical protein